MLIVQLALRNARRNVRRTLLTALTVFFGTALLTVSMAWIDGVFGQINQLAADTAGHVRVVAPAYAEREKLLPLYENVPTSLEDRLSVLPGVTGVEPRIITGATLTNTEEIGDVFGPVMGGRLTYFDRLGLADPDALVQGTFFTGDGSEQILLGARVAQRLDAKIGEEIVLLGLTQDGAMSPVKAVLVGIVSVGNALVDQGAFLPLDKVQYLTDIPDGATEILVYTNDADDAYLLKQTVEDAALGEYTVQTWSERPPMNVIVGVSGVVKGVLAVLIVFITSLGVWNTMMMSVLERTGEIGVMRAMGMPRLGSVTLFVIEGLLIASSGGLAGVFFGGLWGMYLETNGITLGDDVTQNMDADIPIVSTLYADMTWEIGILAFLLGLSIALVGTALPALRAASIQPVEAMRARR